MKKPIRIQRKRVKGWKLPEGAVVVTRPTKWGNPWAVLKMPAAVDYQYYVLGPHSTFWAPSYWTRKEAIAKAVANYADWIKKKLSSGELDITELKGKDLACFCGPDQECHADILLRIANP